MDADDEHGPLIQRELETLDEVELLIRSKAESTDPVVMRHYVGERRRAAVVKVRRVLPQCAQRSCAVSLAGGPRRVRSICGSAISSFLLSG
jgi:hypothetical protein